MLIVEDEMLIAVGIEQVALELGARMTRILRSPEALALIDRCDQTPDICVVDYRAASDDNRRIAEFFNGSTSKLIVVTTDSEPGTDTLYKAADAIVQKPFGDEDVRRAFYAAFGVPQGFNESG